MLFVARPTARQPQQQEHCSITVRHRGPEQPPCRQGRELTCASHRAGCSSSHEDITPRPLGMAPASDSPPAGRYTPPMPVLPEVRLLPAVVHTDARGFFVETWSQARLKVEGIDAEFVQDNLVGSVRGVLRGLHIQVGLPQSKLVTLLQGQVFDVAVDLRPASPSFGAWVGFELDAQDRASLWIPAGFAHGYYVRSETALLAYKVTAPWFPAGERVLRWDDPTVGVVWPVPAGESPVLSERDAAGQHLADLNL